MGEKSSHILLHNRRNSINKGSKIGLLTLYYTLKDVFHFMIYVSNPDILIIINFTALVLTRDANYDLN